MRAETPSSVSRKRRWSGFTNSWNRSFEGGSRRARVFALVWLGTFKKARPGIGRAPRESDFWYPLGRRRQPELLRVHDGFAWRSTADLRPSKNSRWADVAVRQMSYDDCSARADRRSFWAEAVRVLQLRPLGVHSQRSREPDLSMVRVSLQRVRSEGRTHGWPGCLALTFGRGAARTRDS
jgi:hypothetical protein